MVYQSLLDFPKPDDSKLTLFDSREVEGHQQQPLSSGHVFFTGPQKGSQNADLPGLW